MRACRSGAGDRQQVSAGARANPIEGSGRIDVGDVDSNHDGPIFPNLAKDVVPTGPNELWVAGSS